MKERIRRIGNRLRAFARIAAGVQVRLILTAVYFLLLPVFVAMFRWTHSVRKTGWKDIDDREKTVDGM